MTPHKDSERWAPLRWFLAIVVVVIAAFLEFTVIVFGGMQASTGTCFRSEAACEAALTRSMVIGLVIAAAFLAVSIVAAVRVRRPWPLYLALPGLWLATEIFVRLVDIGFGR